MDPPTVLSCILLEPFDTSLKVRKVRQEYEKGILGKGLAKKYRIYTNLVQTYILTQEPERFLLAESCAQVDHSLQVSSYTVEFRGLPDFPSLEILGGGEKLKCW